MATVIDTLVVKLGFQIDTQGLSQFEQGIKNLKGQMDSLAKRFTIAGGIGAAGMGLIGKAGLDTEEALLRTRAALSLTEDQMKTLHESALEVGKTNPLNTKDIVNAQLAYGKLGATFEEILRDAPAIAGAAVATNLNPEQVAEYARVIQNVFGGDPQENMDIMLRIANRSPASFAALGESIQFAGQSAVDAGLDFKTYAASLAGTAGAGRSVESVSQGLVAMWGRLAKSGESIGRGGKIVTEAFEGVGISMADVNAAMDGTTDGFVRLLEMINNANLSSQQLTALLSTLAGDTYAASISFAVQNPGAIRDLLKEAELAPGEIARQQEIILSGASGGIKEMLAQIDTLLNRLAQLGVLTAIEQFARGISKLVGWLTETNEEDELVRGGFLRTITVLGGLLSSLLVVGAALKALSFALSGWVGLVKLAHGAAWLWRNALLRTRLQLFLLTLQTWRANAAQVAHRITTLLSAAATNALSLSFWRNVVAQTASRIAMIAGTIATIAATVATTAFGIAMTVATGPIGLVILGIAALIAGVVLLIKNWGWVKEKVAVVWDFILGAVQGVWNWIKANWPLLLAILTGPIGLAVWAVVKFKDDIIGVFTGVKDAVFGIWQSIWDFILGVWEKIKAPIEAVTGFVEGVGGTIVGGVQAVVPGFQQGGMVPGAPGKPLLSMLHGGELVLPAHVAANLRAIGQGYDLTPIIPGYDYGRGGGAPRTVHEDNRTINISDGAIVINPAPGQNAEEIAREVKKALGDELRNTAQDLDSDILR